MQWQRGTSLLLRNPSLCRATEMHHRRVVLSRGFVQKISSVRAGSPDLIPVKSHLYNREASAWDARTLLHQVLHARVSETSEFLRRRPTFRVSRGRVLLLRHAPTRNTDRLGTLRVLNYTNIHGSLISNRITESWLISGVCSSKDEPRLLWALGIQLTPVNLLWWTILLQHKRKSNSALVFFAFLFLQIQTYI